MKLTAFLFCFALGAATPAFAATSPTNNLITACVGKLGGFTRIVASPAGCDQRYETVLQFNQQGLTGPIGATGPAGPTGPQGPAGPAAAPPLTRTLYVPDTGSGQLNGALLLNAINLAARTATIARPFLIQLDAGYYALPDDGVLVPSNVSFKGAGMYLTTVYSGGVVFTFFETPAIEGVTGAQFSVSDMTLSSPSGSIVSYNARLGVIDHVRASYRFALYSKAGDILISNSILTGPVSLGSSDPSVRLRVVGSEIDNLDASQAVTGTLGCFASYNAVLAPYGTNCQLSGQ